MPDLPPGPPIRLWTTYQVLAHPMTAMPSWFRRYGDPMLVNAINGNVVMTAQPELVKKIFAAPGSTYSPFAAQATAVLTGPRSLFQLRGEPHRRHRQLIMPPFHGSRMRAYAAVMQQTTREVIGAAVGAGRMPLHELTQQISLEVILRTVFGVQEPARVRTFSEAIKAVIAATSPLFLFMPFLQRAPLGLGPWAKFTRARTVLEQLLHEQIALTRARTQGEDVLSLLLEARDEQGDCLDDEEIRDELRTLLFAGHETTAIALCWAVDALGRHPAVAKRLAEELGSLPGHRDHGHDQGHEPGADAEALTKLPYLEAVCNESLRLYPIVTEVLRTMHEPIELGGYTIRPPDGVSASIWGIHMNPEIYPEPTAFRPERFLERKYGPHEFLPFGGGHRRCIGAAFASFEMRVVLGTLLREFTVKLCEPHAPRPVRRNVTLAPEGGVPVIITADRPGSVTAAAA